MDVIADMLQLIYRLDKIVSPEGMEKEAESVIRVTAETMKRVQVYLKDFTEKVGKGDEDAFEGVIGIVE